MNKATVDNSAFFSVIKAIDSASEKELRAIANVERAIVNDGKRKKINPRRSSISRDKHRTGGKRVKAKRDLHEKARSKERRLADQAQDNQVLSGIVDASEATTKAAATLASKAVVAAENAAVKDHVVDADKPGPKEATTSKETTTTSKEAASKETIVNRPGPVVDSKAVVAGGATEESSDKEKAQTRDNNQKTTKGQEKANELLKGLYEDSQGRLRQENGAFASRKQKEALAASKKAQDGSTDNVLKTLSGWMLGKTQEVADNGATDGAGVAVGSSFWLAAKEAAQFVGDTKSFVEDNGLSSKEAVKNKIDTAKSAIKDPMSAIKNHFGFTNNDGEQVSSPVEQVSSSVDREVSPQGPVVKESRAALERKENKEASSLAAVTDEQTDVLEEQNATQIALLEKIEKAISANGGGGGLFGDGGIDFERKRKGGKRRSRARRGGKLSRMKSVLSSSGNTATSFAKNKGGSLLSKGGGLLSGAGALAKGAGKLIPFLAPALAAYEAATGFTDSDRQKDVFNLKDGQTASLGQKSSMAAGNLLDMGGLVSGGAGLLGSALGGLGFEDAQKALTFNADSITKGVYGLFGGDTKESATDSTKKTETVKVTDSSPEVSAISPSVTQSRIVEPPISREGTPSTAKNIINDARTTASTPKAGIADKKRKDDKAINVIAHTDPKLTKAINELVKVTKESARGDASHFRPKAPANKSTSNVRAMNKGGTAGIPVGPSETQLQLIALDAN